MRNLDEFISSIVLCELDSNVTSAIYFNIDQKEIYIQEDFREDISYCKTFILDSMLNLKQLILK